MNFKCHLCGGKVKYLYNIDNQIVCEWCYYEALKQRYNHE